MFILDVKISLGGVNYAKLLSRFSSRSKRSCRAGSRSEREKERGGRGIISSSVSPEGGRSMIRLPVCLSSGSATLEPVFKLRMISFV